MKQLLAILFGQFCKPDIVPQATLQSYSQET